MKLSFLILLSIFSLSTFANENIEIIQAGEEIEIPLVKISDVKNLIKEIGEDNTCMDEYLKRRRQLITKVAFSPVTIVGGTYVSFFAGGAIGLAAAIVTNAVTNLDPLIYVAYGVAGGALVAGTATITDSSLAVIQLVDIDTILKTLAEQHSNESGKKSDKLYAKFIKKQEYPVSKDVFLARLMDMDASGELCDGSLVKQPRIKIGSKLKYMVARTKHLRKAI